MSKLDDLTAELVRTTDGAVAFAVIDLDSGLPLGRAHTEFFVPAFMDALCAALVDMVRGRTVTAVEELIAQQRGTASKHLVNELQITTDNTFMFTHVQPEKPHTLFAFITTPKVNLGTGWATVRSFAKSVEDLVP